MKRKLKSRRGETLVETLAAILVISLGSAAFAGMVGVASQFNGAALGRDESYYAALSRAEKHEDEERRTVMVGGDAVDVWLTPQDTDNGYRLASYRSAKEAAP